MNTKGKLLILSAPSGTGKTTIAKRILQGDYPFEFSISATSRQKREGEIHGKDYYFLSPEEFKNKINQEEFVEWEEVYPDQFYGTLKSEIERIRQKGVHVLFDVDVLGGVNLKKQFGEEALSVFIKPPSIEVLEERLKIRNSENPESLKKRLSRAEMELSYADKFDIIVVNDVLENALLRMNKILAEYFA